MSRIPTAPLLLCLALAAAAPPLAAQTGGAPPKVSVAAAYVAPVTEETAFIARAEAVDRVDLIARVTGFLREVAVADGQQVAQGQLLFRIEPEQYEAALAARKAELARAEANLSLARIELDRRTQLVQRGSVPQSELDVARANAAVAEADVAAAQAALRRAELDLSYTEVTAPFDGRLGRIPRSVGELVGPGTGALATLVREQPIFLSFSLGERQLANIMEQSGSSIATPPEQLEVHARLPNGTRLEETGRIRFGDNRIDPATGTLAVRAEFANARGLIIDGGFLSVTISAPTPVDRLLVPQAALQRDQRGDFVLVVGAQGLVEQRYVTTGRQVGTAMVVEDGLQQGESVIVEGLQRVRPGVPVEAVTAGTEG